MASLRCLTYYNAIRLTYHPLFPVLFSCLPSLVHLTLEGFTLKSFYDLRTIICALKNLRELHLAYGFLDYYRRLTRYPSLESPRIRAIALTYLDTGLSNQLVKWMVSSKIFHSCVDLYLGEESVLQAIELSEAVDLFRTLGPSLTHLTCSDPSDEQNFCAYSTISTLCAVVLHDSHAYQGNTIRKAYLIAPTCQACPCSIECWN